MKIAVTSETPQGLESKVNHHFGRCPYYTIVTVENGAIASAQAIPNPGADGHGPGELPALIKQLGVDVLLTGGMGPRAVDFFTRYGIEVATGAQGTVRSAVEAYLAGRLRGYTPCKEHGQDEGRHHGEGGHRRGHH